MRELETLGVNYTAGELTNAWEQVAGRSNTAYGEDHASSWTPSGGIQDSGTLEGRWSIPVGINTLGHGAGTSIIESGHTHPFRWTPARGMQDLGTLRYDSRDATAFEETGISMAFAWSTPNIQPEDPTTGWIKLLARPHTLVGVSVRPAQPSRRMRHNHPIGSEQGQMAPSALVLATRRWFACKRHAGAWGPLPSHAEAIGRVPERRHVVTKSGLKRAIQADRVATVLVSEAQCRCSSPANEQRS